MIAKQDKAINAAFKQLEIASQDTKKRLEYNARVKAAMDYNTIMEERYESGKAEGRAEGRAEERQQLIIKWREMGISEEKIKELLS